MSDTTTGVAVAGTDDDTELAPQWADARTLADLAHLTANWLEGRLHGAHPAHVGPPDEETLPLAPALATANRNGFLTLCSQPGLVETIDGELWEQHAFVDGLVSSRTLLLRLADEAWHAGLQIAVHPPFGRTDGWETPVTYRDGDPVTVAGHRMPASDLAHYWEQCHPDAAAATTTAWQVALIDPEPGRALPLPALLRSLAIPASTTP